MKNSNKLLNLRLPLKFKNCDIGDIYDSKSFECRTCSAGSYSLGDPYDPNTVCKGCVPSAICLGGSIMPP